MIASDNEYLQEASNALYDLNADYNVREHFRNREEYYGIIRAFENELDTMKDKLVQSENKLIQSENKLAQKDLEIERLQAELANLRSRQKI